MGSLTRGESKLPANGRLWPWAKRIFAVEEATLILVVIAVALAIGIPNPNFFSELSLFAVLRQASFIALMAFGMVYLLAMTEIDLSVGAIYGLSATIAALIIKSGVDPWIAVVIAILICGLLGAVNGLLSNILAIPIVIISLGTLSAYKGASLVLSDARAIFGLPSGHFFFRIFGGEWFGLPAPVWTMILIGIALHFVFWNTRFGGIIRAMGSNPSAAEFIGLPVARYRIYVTALLGALSGLSGVLTMAFFKASDNSLGVGLELQVVAAVVIGGTSLSGGSGTIIGAFTGVVLITLISSGLVFFGISGNWAPGVTGVVVVAAIAMDRIVKRRRASALTTGLDL